MLVARVQLYWSGTDCEPFWLRGGLNGHQQRLLCASFEDTRLMPQEKLVVTCWVLPATTLAVTRA